MIGKKNRGETKKNPLTGNRGKGGNRKWMGMVEKKKSIKLNTDICCLIYSRFSLFVTPLTFFLSQHPPVRLLVFVVSRFLLRSRHQQVRAPPSLTRLPHAVLPRAFSICVLATKIYRVRNISELESKCKQYTM